MVGVSCAVDVVLGNCYRGYRCCCGARRCWYVDVGVRWVRGVVFCSVLVVVE